MRPVTARFTTYYRGIAVLAGLLWMLWSVPSAVALTWTIETPYVPAAVKGHNSIVFDSNNEPHISFYAIDVNGMSLWMASKSGTGGWWTGIEDPSSGVGKYNALAINPDNNTKHISYYDALNGDLRYFSAGGNTTSWEIVDSAGDVGKYTDITLDSSRYPHISYYDAANGNLKYARYECIVSGCGWVIETVAPAGNFVSEGLDAETAIALDSTDTPHILYTGGFANGRRLRHAWKSGGVWVTEEVGIQSDCLAPSLAIDSSGNLHISYLQYYAPSKWLYLRYGTRGASLWNTEQVAFAGVLGPYYPGDMGFATSLALDSTNQPHISYPYGADSGSMDYDLMYAAKGAFSWLIETVDAGVPAGIYPGDVGRYSSIALGPGDLPHISYYDRTNGYLKYAAVSPNTLTVSKSGTGTGTVVSSPAGIDCGVACSAVYATGTVVVLGATPAADSFFAGFGGNADCTDGMVTMDSDKTCTATFTKTWFEETDPAITYTGTWKVYEVCPSCSGGSLKYSAQTGARADFSFTGTGIRWIVVKGPMMGKARVYLDGVNMGLVDLYSPTVTYQVILQKTGLEPVNHTLTLEVSGQKNPSATNTVINIDAFEVVP